MGGRASTLPVVLIIRKQCAANRALRQLRRRGARSCLHRTSPARDRALYTVCCPAITRYLWAFSSASSINALAWYCLQLVHSTPELVVATTYAFIGTRILTSTDYSFRAERVSISGGTADQISFLSYLWFASLRSFLFVLKSNASYLSFVVLLTFNFLVSSESPSGPKGKK